MEKEIDWNDLAILTVTESELLDVITVLHLMVLHNPGDDRPQKALQIVQGWNQNAKRLKIKPRETKISIRRSFKAGA